MNGSVPARAGPAPKTPSERVTHLSHRYLLPVAGACAVTLGGLVVLGVWRGTGPALYWTLLVVGLSALVSSFGFLAWQDGATAERDAVRTPPPVRRPTPDPPVAAPRPTATPTVAAHHHRNHPHSGIGRAAVSAAARPDDQLWRLWTAPKSRPLGVAASGPVAQSWYFPAKSGGVGPFSTRDRDLLFLSPDRHPIGFATPTAGLDPSTLRPPAPVDRSSRSPALPRTEPFSELELEELFPTGGAFDAVAFSTPSPPPTTTPVPVAPAETVRPGSSIAPAPAAAPEATSPPAAVGPVAPPRPSADPSWEVPGTGDAALAEAGVLVGGPSGLPTLDSLDHQIYLEAINPLPPHLRSSPRVSAKPAAPAAPAGPAGSRRTAPTSPLGVCAMCARRLADFRSWAECPRCTQPMCRECLGLSFLTGAEGRCFSCRDAHGPPAA